MKKILILLIGTMLFSGCVAEKPKPRISKENRLAIISVATELAKAGQGPQAGRIMLDLMTDYDLSADATSTNGR